MSKEPTKTLRLCSAHYYEKMQEIYREAGAFDRVKISILRKDYKLEQKCDHDKEKGERLRCNKLPIYRVEVIMEVLTS